MIVRPGHTLLRVLATALVLIQVAFSGLGAIAHPGDAPGKTHRVSAPAAPDRVLHDELRCPLCQFASQQAQHVPVCEVSTCVTVENAVIRNVAVHYAELPPHFVPSWRAPPVSFS